MSSGFAQPHGEERDRAEYRQPVAEDPLLIMAMDHRESFGRVLFGVRDDNPTQAGRYDRDLKTAIIVKTAQHLGRRAPEQTLIT